MRNSTENIYRQTANQVIDYIGANLHRSLPLKATADKVHVSQKHNKNLYSDKISLFRSFSNENDHNG